MAGRPRILSHRFCPGISFRPAAWHAGRIPLWEPNQWFGQPLIGQAQPGVAYPLNWVLFALPLRDSLGIEPANLHTYFVLIHLMAAWFAYKLARELGCRRLVNIGASIFSLAGWLGSTEWPQMIDGAVWAPLHSCICFAPPGGEPIRSSILAGFFLGMAWLSGHHQVRSSLPWPALASGSGPCCENQESRWRRHFSCFGRWPAQPRR